MIETALLFATFAVVLAAPPVLAFLGIRRIRRHDQIIARLSGR